MSNQHDALELEFMSDDSRAGFRLKRLEVLNWGTFDGRPWVIDLDGRNALVTGDIGSGKSTLVDAVTTLLIPSNRVAYNKAAGADARERSLRTYVHGHYKAERSEMSGGSRPVALRDSTSYSVLLGVFENEGFGQTVTLAQVFWSRSATDQISRLFVGVDTELAIAPDFVGFGTEMRDLRKRLRGQGAEIWDSFPGYGSWFRRRFGLGSPQALDLFHQTVSMKSVGNLTDFVREHMLAESDVQARIDALIDHFNDLNRAHEAVLKAKHQVSLLTPIVSDSATHAERSVESADLRSCRGALSSAMSRQRLDLLERELDGLARKHGSRSAEVNRFAERRAAARVELDDVARSIAENGGGRIEFLTSQIETRSAERDRRKAAFDRLGGLAEALDLSVPTSMTEFDEMRAGVSAQIDQVDQAETSARSRLTELEVDMRERRAEEQTLAAEIDNLERRPNNIPNRQVQLRETLAAGTGIDIEALAFAGELIEVDDDHAEWEGAIERVLHNFGLSLLVADEHYREVSNWVDRTHLRDRLVYLRVRSDQRTSPVDLDRASLVNKVNVKPTSQFREWILDELGRRFDYVCCDDQEQFRRERFAITRAGQVKAGGRRHEKDDRFRVDDRRRYVLGWSNTAKLATLIEDQKQLRTTIAEIAAHIVSSQQEVEVLRDRRSRLSEVGHFRDFVEIDWASVAREVEDYKAERRALEESSDLLARLTERQSELRSTLDDVEEQLERAQARRAKLEQQIDDRTAERDEALAATQQPEFTEHGEWFERLSEIQDAVLGDASITLSAIDRAERDIREWLQDEIDKLEKSLGRLSERIVRAMKGYCDDYPVETQEVSASLDSADEFARMLEALESDGLPAFEARFKEQLNVNTIREIVNFQSHLHRERDDIGERIERINTSLTKIDYNPGRYIAVVADRSRDQEIAAFLQDLRACSEQTLTGSDDDQYSEAKFLQVKAIVERFAGRAGQTDLDRRWTAKVTDVRNWFVFNASERWREDDTEHEHYSDSSGKSGGQKEKLAYTILAASLAYQFGLEWGEARSRTFRFVVIDEAFGRGSDDSARYGLQLFNELNLQLLIVTPLQKIHVIEPFVSNVGYVTNDGGRSSRVHNLTIEEYRARKAQHQGA